MWATVFIGLLPTVAAVVATLAWCAIVATAETAIAGTILTGLGLRLVDAKRASLEVVTIDGIDSCLCLIFVRHLHEAEALGAAGCLVCDDSGGSDLAVLSE